MQRRTHGNRRKQRIRRLMELIKEGQIQGVRFGNHWRVNRRFDYWPNSGRVLDRGDPERWFEGRVSCPDELVAVARGAQLLRVTKVSRKTPWRVPWTADAESKA